MSNAQPLSAEPTHNPVRRKRLFTLLAGVVAAGAIGAGVYWHFVSSRFISTDNAYTAAEVAQVTPSVGGIVSAVKVVDTQHVKKGDVLVIIDDTDARLALAEADAELGRAMRRVKGYVANDLGLSAQINAREADERRAAAQLTGAEADFERARIDLTRRQALAGSGSVSGDELSRAQNAFTTAQANLEVAHAAAAQARANRASALGSRAVNAVLIADADLESNPEVALARARRDQAQVNLARTVVHAPIDGVVVRRQVQVGQRVQSGFALLSVVPVQEMHVDANFKEVQLDRVKIGQPVELKSDRYGGDVIYHGVVEGISGGTGAAFATIPAQNATGNWIKVVQRLPVRVRLNAEELASRPLQVGLSMIATIDTHH